MIRGRNRVSRVFFFTHMISKKIHELVGEK